MLLSGTGFKYPELSKMHLPRGCYAASRNSYHKGCADLLRYIEGAANDIHLTTLQKNNIFFAVYPTSAVMNLKVESDPSVCVVLLFTALMIMLIECKSFLPHCPHNSYAPTVLINPKQLLKATVNIAC